MVAVILARRADAGMGTRARMGVRRELTRNHGSWLEPPRVWTRYALKIQKNRQQRDWIQNASRWLVDRFELIGIARLNTARMTRSAHATVQPPSSNGRAKSGLDRACSTPVCGCSPASSTAKPTGQEQGLSKSTRGSRTRSCAASAKRRTPRSSSPREPGPAPQPEGSTTATRMRPRTYETRSSNCSDHATRHEHRTPSRGIEPATRRTLHAPGRHVRGVSMNVQWTTRVGHPATEEKGE